MLKEIPNKGKIKFKKAFEERYKFLLGKRYDEFIKYSLAYLRKSIRTNTLKISVPELKKRLSGDWQLDPIPWYKEGFWIEHESGRRDIGNTIEHALGYIYVQESASMIPPAVLSPRPGEIVLDMCSAPGSKSTQIAQSMKNKGLLVCNDLTTKRIAPLSINLQRCGVLNSIVTIMNGQRFGRMDLEFDSILVDAPCSGTGTIRKSLKTIDMWNPLMVKRLARTQKSLIESGFLALKEKGTLVYSTCTLEPEENEGVVDYLLNKFENAELMDIKLEIKRSEPVLSFNGTMFDKRIKKCLRIWPQDNNSEGFFVAKIVKN